MHHIILCCLFTLHIRPQLARTHIDYVLQRKLENEIKGFDDVYKAKKRTCLEDSEKFRRELKRVSPRSKLAPLALMKFTLLSVAP